MKFSKKHIQQLIKEEVQKLLSENPNVGKAVTQMSNNVRNAFDAEERAKVKKAKDEEMKKSFVPKATNILKTRYGYDDKKAQEAALKVVNMFFDQGVALPNAFLKVTGKPVPPKNSAQKSQPQGKGAPQQKQRQARSNFNNPVMAKIKTSIFNAKYKPDIRGLKTGKPLVVQIAYKDLNGNNQSLNFDATAAGFKPKGTNPGMTQNRLVAFSRKHVRMLLTQQAKKAGMFNESIVMDAIATELKLMLSEAHGLSRKDLKVVKDHIKKLDKKPGMKDLKRILKFLAKSNVKVDKTQDVTKMKKEKKKSKVEEMIRVETLKLLKEQKSLEQILAKIKAATESGQLNTNHPGQHVPAPGHKFEVRVISGTDVGGFTDESTYGDSLDHKFEVQLTSFNTVLAPYSDPSSESLRQTIIKKYGKTNPVTGEEWKPGDKGWSRRNPDMEYPESMASGIEPVPSYKFEMITLTSSGYEMYDGIKSTYRGNTWDKFIEEMLPNLFYHQMFVAEVEDESCRAARSRSKDWWTCKFKENMKAMGMWPEAPEELIQAEKWFMNHPAWEGGEYAEEDGYLNMPDDPNELTWEKYQKL